MNYNRSLGALQRGEKHEPKKILAGVGAFLLLLAYTPSAAAAPSDDYTGWINQSDGRHWYDAGVEARSKEIYDPASAAWYWIDADGTMAQDKDVYLRSNGGKWVRYDHEGHMIRGEDLRYGGWYYFDPVTGAMAKGMRYILSNGGKWVYYDWITGKMAHGEAYVNYDATHTGWYLFDQHTGAMYHGYYFNVPQNKWVYYDQHTGIMDHDLGYINGAWYYFDHYTGKMAHKMTYVPGWNAYKYFDDVDGRWNQGQETADWTSPSQEGGYPNLSRVANLNVDISIANQQVYICDGNRVIYTMIASTGLNDWTPRGNYTVNGRGTYFMNPDGMGARNWVRFLGPYLFHSVPINRSGQYIVSEAQKLGRPASHGCARLTIPDSLWLYQQLRDGTPVHVY